MGAGIGQRGAACDLHSAAGVLIAAGQRAACAMLAWDSVQFSSEA